MLDGEHSGQPLAETDPRAVGPYEILGVLGSGAMGRVYLGRAADGSAAAVKVVRADLADITMFRKRFARELSVVRKIDGARIARVIDADADAGQPWIATEHIAGPSLQSRIDEGGVLPNPELRALAHAVAAALTEIHAAGVVHRDLKPSNVLLGPDGPKVIDFGVAHASDASVVLTGTGHVPGTPAYMSPEQAEAKGVGPETDVFALGSLLVFAGTGRLAFGDGAPLAVLNRVLNGEPDLDGVADRDAALRALITACLDKDPAKRPTPARILEVCDKAATHAGEPVAEPGAAVGEVSSFLPTEAVAATPDAPVAAAAVTDTIANGGHRPHRKKLVAGGVAGLLAIAAILAASLGGGDSDKGNAAARESSGSRPGGVLPVATGSDPASSGGTAAPGSTDPAAASQGSVPGGAPASGDTGSAPAGAAAGGVQPPAGSAGPTGSAPNAGASSSPAGKPPATTAPAQPRPTTTQPPVSHPTTTTPPPATSSKPPANNPPGPMPTPAVNEPGYIGVAQLIVSWTAHSDATSYDIHYTNDFGSGIDQIYNSTGTSYTIDNVAAGSHFCIWMRAVNQYGSSSWSQSICHQA